MTAIVHVYHHAVASRLAELGLEEGPLRDVVRRGYLAFISCTANHPPFIPGIWAWGETVRALREYVMPMGWTRSDENSYSVVIDPQGHTAIAVATGDEGTGRSDASPATKSPKGPSTSDAVASNQMAFVFMSPTPSVAIEAIQYPADDRMTWLLLIHRAIGEVRCELALPSSMGLDGRVDGWRERIILGSIPLDGDTIEITPPPQPDININVQRRA